MAPLQTMARLYLCVLLL